MNKLREPLLDSELDRLLSAASKPPEFLGFEQRLAGRIAASGSLPQRPDNVVPFTKGVKQVAPAPRAALRRVSIGAALAASLMLGLLIGNTGDVSGFLDGVTGTSGVGQLAEFAPEGLDELGKLEGET